MSVPIDIERLLQIVIGQSGRLPWRGTHPRELMIDGGYTVVPKGCEREYHSTGLALSCPAGVDAQRVLAAVMDLDPAVGAMVIACARAGIRPQWQLPPRRVPVAKRHKKKHRKVVIGYRLEAPAAEAIRAAQSAYGEWHAALAGLAALLRGALAGWQINAFAAAAEPWRPAAEKAA